MKPASLRATLTVVISVLVGLGLIVSGALVILTTHLTSKSAILQESVGGVRRAQQAQVLLLLHARAEDPVVARQLEHALWETLSRAADHVTTDGEAGILHGAEAGVRAYLSAARSAEPRHDRHRQQDSAYGALDALVDENVAQARAAMQDAERWDRVANVLGGATAVLPLALAVWLLSWLKGAVLRPLLVLARAMEKFGNGDRDTRAEELGPLEVREMAARFNEMASAFVAQREMQMAFLAGVAHDLRNPLSALTMSVASIRPDRPLPPEPRLRRTVEVLLRQLARMDRMLGDFLDMAKIEAGRLDLQLETMDARAFVRDVTELFETTAARHRVETTLPGDEVLVLCDRLRMEQVLLNLLGNALKYSPGGGAILVSLAQTGEEAVIEVTDGGIGMSEEEQRLLFEPFQRQGMIKDAVPGTGLGLFVVKRVVTAHGGTIEVESAPGRGSTFRVRMPIAT